MFTMDTQNNESGLLTTTRPGANPFQPDDELSGFLRDLAMRRGRPTPAAAPVKRAMGANANVGAPSRLTTQHEDPSEAAFAATMRQMQLEQMRGEPVFTDTSGGIFTGMETAPGATGSGFTGRFRGPGLTFKGVGR